MHIFTCVHEAWDYCHYSTYIWGFKDPLEPCGHLHLSMMVLGTLTEVIHDMKARKRKKKKRPTAAAMNERYECDISILGQCDKENSNSIIQKKIELREGERCTDRMKWQMQFFFPIIKRPEQNLKTEFHFMGTYTWSILKSLLTRKNFQEIVASQLISAWALKMTGLPILLSYPTHGTQWVLPMVSRYILLLPYA